MSAYEFAVGMKSRSAWSTGRSADRVKLSCGRSDDQIRLPRKFGVLIEELRFARDSLLEESGFELVWGFSCQVVVLGFAESSLFGAGKPFFVPSPAIRFSERAGGVKGPKR